MRLSGIFGTFFRAGILRKRLFAFPRAPHPNSLLVGVLITANVGPAGGLQMYRRLFEGGRSLTRYICLSICDRIGMPNVHSVGLSNACP